MGYVNKLVHRNQDADKAEKHEKERVQGNRKRTGKMSAMGLQLNPQVAAPEYFHGSLCPPKFAYH